MQCFGLPVRLAVILGNTTIIMLELCYVIFVQLKRPKC
jgi:hypothetical protein